MKPGVFIQIFIQLVFAVKNKNCLLEKKIRPDIYAYMGGILKDLKHKPLIINGIADHVHIFYGVNPNVSVSDTVKQIKSSSSTLINDKKMIYDKFGWQDGYGGFSYSQSQIKNVYNYIANQEEHHKRKTFKEEYIEFLEKFEIEYNPMFLFEFFDDVKNDW
jgi:putative transposase